LVASTNISGSIPASTGPLRIGGNSLWGEFFDGRIDEVRIYSRALSIAEITVDMNTPIGSPLHLFGDVGNTAELDVLTAEEVRPLFDEAVARWQTLLSDQADVRRLQNATIQIMDLPGTTLGLATSTVIWIDVDGAGHGWFVDSTPWDDSEFSPETADASAAARVDLLTVLAHELGHQLGLADDYSTDPYTGNVMSWALPPGVRRIGLTVSGEQVAGKPTRTAPQASVMPTRQLDRAIPHSSLNVAATIQGRGASESLLALLPLWRREATEKTAAAVDDATTLWSTIRFDTREPILLHSRRENWHANLAEFGNSPNSDRGAGDLIALDLIFAQLGDDPSDASSADG
jgi:hypothetical protein